MRMFPNFRALDIDINGIRIRGRIGPNQNKPPLLLLHGHPETHVMWHRVAPELSNDYFVVAPDLRGYGFSGRPGCNADHATYSKRQMAQDCIKLMQALGHDRFFVAGHDRGGRVAARLATDAPESVIRAMLLDVAPTLDMYDRTTRAFATSYWHWFFLIQPAPLPEKLIEANPRAYIEGVMGGRHAGLQPFPPDVLDCYVSAITGEGKARGICEDYRAAATIDLEHDRIDRAERRYIEPPLRILWAKYGVIEKLFHPIQLWENVAWHVSGHSIDSGHYIAEENPGETIEEMLSFFAANSS